MSTFLKGEVVDVGHFLRWDLTKNTFFSQFFFLKMCSERSVLGAYELLFLSFIQIFWGRATQSWPKHPFSKMGFDIFLTFFEILFLFLGKFKPFFRGQCFVLFRSINIKGSAGLLSIRCFVNFGIFKNQFSKKALEYKKCHNLTSLSLAER